MRYEQVICLGGLEASEKSEANECESFPGISMGFLQSEVGGHSEWLSVAVEQRKANLPNRNSKHHSEHNTVLENWI